MTVEGGRMKPMPPCSVKQLRQVAGIAEMITWAYA
jgi:hypothetical protein